MSEYRKVTIRIPVEIWTEDPDGDLSKLRELTVAISEIVTEYIQGDVDIAATGETTVTDGWEEETPESEFLSLLRAAVEEFNASSDGNRLAGAVTGLCNEHTRGGTS